MSLPRGPVRQPDDSAMGAATAAPFSIAAAGDRFGGDLSYRPSMSYSVAGTP